MNVLNGYAMTAKSVPIVWEIRLTALFVTYVLIVQRSYATAEKDAQDVQNYAIAVTRDVLTVPRICSVPIAERAGIV